MRRPNTRFKLAAPVLNASGDVRAFQCCRIPIVNTPFSAPQLKRHSLGRPHTLQAMTAPRHGGTAAFLSLLTPGLGHLYAGRGRTALVLGMLVTPTAALLFLLNVLAAPPAALFLVFAVGILLSIVVGIPIHAAIVARRAGSTYELQKFNRPYVYLAFFLLVGLVWQRGFYLLWRGSVVEAFRIPSAAGEPTLFVGDYIFVVKFPPSARRPHLDSLVVFRSPEQSGLRVIKRAVGLPGDTVSMRDGLLYRNGRQLNEPYARLHDQPIRSDDQYVSQMRAWQLAHLVDRDSARYLPSTRDWGPIAVPPDSFFALGDNRDESYDSRFYGFVPLRNVSARPRLIYFSYDRGSGIRWERVAQRIR